MATDNQVALARTRVPVSTQISKAARQVVPAFLQKLYEMVNDPNNAELIRWSDSGDSFFVLDHERFAHEVLGRWFKHKNFASFVRQLNMYGFHKIPHLQQGVLKSDNETEFWNFAHTNFHRGQPDLLCLIQRKKQIPQVGDDGMLDIRGGKSVAGAAGSNTVAPIGPNGQLLDMQSIISGLQAIKRHQTTISSELQELKRSNQLLWQDALESRAKYQKQQDTINRILNFLAGVFNPITAGKTTVGANHPSNDADNTPVRRKALLMIEDTKRDGLKKARVEELPLEMDASPMSPSFSTPFASAETPVSVPSPSPSVAPSESDVPAFYPSTTTNNPTLEMPTTRTSNPSSSLGANLSVPAPQSQSNPSSNQEQGIQLSRATSPNRPPFEFDPRVQSVFQSLSPPQLQALLSSLAAQTLTDPSVSTPPSSAPTGLIAPYPNNFAYHSNDFPGSAPAPTTDGLIPFDQLEGLQDVNLNPSMDMAFSNDGRISSSWRGTEDLSKDISALDSQLNLLIQDFGLDPSILDADPQVGAIESAPAAAPDFDFDSFLQGISNSSGSGMSPPRGGMDGMVVDGAGYEDFDSGAAFLDDVHTPSSSGQLGSPVQQLNGLPVDPTANGVAKMNVTPAQAQAAMSSSFPASSSASSLAFPPPPVVASSVSGGVGRKRKSDVILEVDPTASSSLGRLSPTTSKTATATATKTKRRKDK